MRERSFGCSLFLLAVCLAPARADESPAVALEVDKLFATWDKPNSPGCAVAVVRGGKIIYERGFGAANLEHQIRVKPTTTRFNIGSVSKQFTTFAIALLAKDGRLNLDVDIRKHLPEMPDFGESVTIRHLIHHTSGLREDWSLLALAGWRAEDVIRQADVLGLIARQKELNFPPGDRYLYCNSGYDLLAAIVQRASGKSLRVFAEERMFGPLGMKETVFFDDFRMLVPNRADCYMPRGGGFVAMHCATERAGPSNLFTTIGDLARWDANFYDGKVGGTAVLAEMHRRGRLASGKEIDYAAGLRLGRYRGLRTVEHGGTTAGYRSVLLRFPEQQFSVIILANLSTFTPEKLAQRIADIYLAAVLAPLPPKPPAVGLTRDQLDAFEGEYRFPSDAIVTATRIGERLWIDAGAGRKPMTAISAAVFVDPDNTRHEFTSTNDTVTLKRPMETGVENGIRAVRPKLSVEQKREFVGTFLSPELGVLFFTELGDDRLVLRHRKGELELRPLAADAFTAPPGSESPFQLLRFERDASKQVSGFRASSARCRNVLFRKTPAGFSP